jgi:purine-binding chemotaxis protein CheW
VSARNDHQSETLIDQPLALRSYLEALLDEVPEAHDEPAPEPPPAARPAPAKPAPVEPRVDVDGDTAELPAQAADASMPPPSQVPEWAADTFQCLVFKVAGLSLAVPLAKLSGVIPWSTVTPMPNRSPMFLGLLHRQERNVKVVDTALVVMPERAAPADPAQRQDGSSHIILIDDGRWGLVCDSVGEVLTLQSTDVRWRSDQGKRPWLAGTVLQHLCAVLDTDALAHLLATGDRDGARPA